jgi:hypothetical protein
MTTMRPATTRPWLKWSLISLFMLWVFGIAAVFYVVQKPFSIEDLMAFIQCRNRP